MGGRALNEKIFMADQKSTDGCLVLEGAATLRTAGAIHARLLEALKGDGPIEVDCGKVTEADLSLVQLLLAARRSAERGGRAFALSSPADGPLRDVLARAGLLPETGETFWLKGRNAV
jgi:anti-anti-sigma regulatory factor